MHATVLSKKKKRQKAEYIKMTENIKKKILLKTIESSMHSLKVFVNAFLGTLPK